MVRHALKLALLGCIALAPLTFAQNTFPSSGNVGIGTTAPEGALDVRGRIQSKVTPPDDTTPAVAGYLWSNRGPGGGAYYWQWLESSPDGAYGLAPNALELYEYPNSGLPACCVPRFRILRAESTTVAPQWITIDGWGHMGIGFTSVGPTYSFAVNGAVHITGNTVIDGNIAAKYQDVAEWVPASESMKPGTVVVIDPQAGNGVMPSARPYDTSVAGVVSAQPGVILGEGSDSKEKIATTGRVRVRVDATKHAISVGDLLVTSDKPGVAMYSQPVDVAGIKMHRPGTLIGKALQSLDKGEGEILVLLSLQ